MLSLVYISLFYIIKSIDDTKLGFNVATLLIKKSLSLLKNRYFYPVLVKP